MLLSIVKAGAIHKGENILSHRDIDLGLPRWELTTTTTMLPYIVKIEIYPAKFRLDEDVLKTSFVFVFRRRLKTSSRRLDQDEYVHLNLSLQKTSSRRLGQNQYIHLVHTSSRRLQDVFKTSSRHLQDVLPRCLQDVFKTSSRRLAKTYSRHLQDVFKTFWKCLQDILKTFSKCTIKLKCSW